MTYTRDELQQALTTAYDDGANPNTPEICAAQEALARLRQHGAQCEWNQSTDAITCKSQAKPIL